MLAMIQRYIKNIQYFKDDKRVFKTKWEHSQLLIYSSTTFPR